MTRGIRMNPGGLAYTIFLGALSALPPLSIDMGLPGIPSIEADLPGAAGQGALTLSLFLAGFALSPLCCGPLADRFGRRRTMAVGLIAFVLAAGLCALSRSFDLLLAVRLAQGVAAGACVIMPLAIVRDVFDGSSSRRHLSRITAVVGLAPMLAPVLGGWVMALGGWRMIYATQALCGAALLAATMLAFSETLPADRRRPLDRVLLLAGYAAVMRDRAFRGNTLLYAFSFAAMFAFISSAPAVLMDGLGLTPGLFALAFGISSCGTLVGSLFGGWLNGREVHGSTIVAWGTGGLVVASLVLLAVTAADLGQMGTIVPLVAVAIFCFGLVGPNANHDALHGLPHVAGSASGLLRCTQMVVGAITSALVARFQPLGQPLWTMAALMVTASLAAAVCLLWLRTGDKRRAPDPLKGELA